MTNVFANMWQVAGKSGMNKSIARFPDVCLSPPSPPAGPIPIPYPDTSFSSDLKEGSETVKVGGKPAALAQKSYYKPSALGNEAATRSFGASVITHQITGKTYFQAWSMDVKFEGKNVCRHIDITTSNHASYPGATPPLNTAEAQARADALARIGKDTCPCCGKGAGACPAALPQTFPNGAAREPLAFEEYYRLDEVDISGAPTATATARNAELAALPCLGGSCPNAGKPHPKSPAPCDVYRVTTAAESEELSKNKHVDKDVHRTKHGIPKAKGAFKNMAPGASIMGIDKPTWDAMDLESQNSVVKIDHTTPRGAGGCPNSTDNTSPHGTKCANCKKKDTKIDSWHSVEQTTRRAALGI